MHNSEPFCHTKLLHDCTHRTVERRPSLAPSASLQHGALVGALSRNVGRLDVSTGQVELNSAFLIPF